MNDDFFKLNKRFQDLLLSVFYDYLLWKYIRDCINEKSEIATLINDRYSDFFIPVLIALQERFLLHLANLFDWVKLDKDKKVISIYELLEFIPSEKKKNSINKKLEKLLPLKTKLIKWRNKYIVHKDYELQINWYEKFIKKNKMSFDKIYELMIKLWKIYDEIYNSVNKRGKKITLFPLFTDLWIGKLFNDIKYFVPKTDKERMKIISKEIIKNIELKQE